MSGFALNPTFLQAQEKLAIALSAKANGNLNLALDLYQDSLTLLLDLYKNTVDAVAKDHYLQIIENNMTEAEKIKQLISQRKTALLQDDIIQRALQTPAGSETTVSIVKARGKTLLPDTHDYTRSTGQSSNSTTPRTNPSNATTNKTNNKNTSPSLMRKAPTTTSTTSTSSNGKGTPLTTASPAKKASHAEYSSQIMDELLDKSPGVRWSDIAGLTIAKQILQETVILPNLRPDLFTGLRAPPKGVLLFGPPGTGKTMLAKAVATESGFAFFSISASTVTSKYMGEGEKLMRAIFEVARDKQPSVIFFDEIDALMSTRKESEHEASRRLKTEFMTQLDGANTSGSDRVLVMGATNLPWDIDEAVLRRLPKRIYVPLPDQASRRALIEHLLRKQNQAQYVTGRSLDRVVSLTEGYSGSDIAALCQEAALGPIRELGVEKLKTVKAEEVRHMNEQDFVNALTIVRPSVGKDSLKTFDKWASQFGVNR